MKTLIAAVTLAVLTSGCATKVPAFNGQPQTLSIRWHKARSQDEVFRLCHSYYPMLLKSGSAFTVTGCYWVEDKVCNVVSIDSHKRLTSLGHEVKHCFDGNWHDAKQQPEANVFLLQEGERE